MEVTKTVSNSTPVVGSTVTFTILVENKGNTSATGVNIQDLLPSGYANATNVSNGGVVGGFNITWSGLSIAANAMISLTFDATVQPTGLYLNTAQVTAANEPDIDSTPNNDDGDQSEDDEGNATVTPQSIDLDVMKTISHPTPVVGQTVTFSIKVSNTGNTAATGVAI